MADFRGEGRSRRKSAPSWPKPDVLGPAMSKDRHTPPRPMKAKPRKQAPAKTAYSQRDEFTNALKDFQGGLSALKALITKLRQRPALEDAPSREPQEVEQPATQEDRSPSAIKTLEKQIHTIERVERAEAPKSQQHKQAAPIREKQREFHEPRAAEAPKARQHERVEKVEAPKPRRHRQAEKVEAPKARQHKQAAPIREKQREFREPRAAEAPKAHQHKPVAPVLEKQRELTELKAVELARLKLPDIVASKARDNTKSRAFDAPRSIEHKRKPADKPQQLTPAKASFATKDSPAIDAMKAAKAIAAGRTAFLSNQVKRRARRAIEEIVKRREHAAPVSTHSSKTRLEQYLPVFRRGGLASGGSYVNEVGERQVAINYWEGDANLRDNPETLPEPPSPGQHTRGDKRSGGMQNPMSSIGGPGADTGGGTFGVNGPMRLEGSLKIDGLADWIGRIEGELKNV